MMTDDDDWIEKLYEEWELERIEQMLKETDAERQVDHIEKMLEETDAEKQPRDAQHPESSREDNGGSPDE